MSGYIKLNRKFFENFLWNEARIYSKAEAWIDLIRLARFEASTEIVNGKVIEVQRGELPVSRRFLELRWNWGSTRVSNFLRTLTDLGMINQRQTNGQTILVLVNYGVYNDVQTSGKPPDKPEANQRQTTDKPAANQNKEYKKEEEFKEGKEESTLCAHGDLIDEVLNYFGFNQIRHPDKLSQTYMFLNILETDGQIMSFCEQFTAYKAFKEQSGEVKFSFPRFIGTIGERYLDGGWNARNWVFELENLKKNPSKTESVSDAFARIKQQMKIG